LHYELHKNVALQRRISLRQAKLLEDEKEKVATLEQKLEENQGSFPVTRFLCQFSGLWCLYILLE
jgi:hypothetical protein